MILKTITALALRLVRQTDAPETPPLSLRPPCQSELKRTLRRGGPPANAVHSQAFYAPHAAHSALMVNDRFRRVLNYGFEMVDAPSGARLRTMMGINRKFTPNRIIPVFTKFSATLPQWKHLRFIGGC